jgi:SH3 domain-containing protein 21
MRANRAKAPKRRPPTSAVNILGEPNNNVLNGAGGIFIDNNNYPPDSPKSTGSGGVAADQDGGDQEMSARPRTREWEKHKVPWMDELKLSQAKKTTTGGVGELSKSPPEAQSRSTAAIAPDTTSDEKYDMSKSFSNSSFHKKSSLDHGGSQTTTTEIRPTTFDHHKINSSTSFDSGGNTNNNTAMMMTKSMSSLSTKISISASSTTAVGGANSTTTTIQENINENNTTNHTQQPTTGRPTSVTMRNRSISPLSRNSQQKPPHVSSTSSINQSVGSPEIIRVSTTTTNQQQGEQHNNVTAARGYYDLEQRVNKLERIVKTQNLLIDELVKLLGDDSERIRILRSELDKHTQAVIQDQKLVYL